MSNDKRKSEAEWKQILPAEVFEIARNGGTERAFTGKYYQNKESGVYHCACCQTALFTSNAKYDSGSGWPSFYEAVAEGVITEKQDTSHGMVRTEILCSACDAHLGHVFPDGPEPSGLRFCVNSASLGFEKE